MTKKKRTATQFFDVAETHGLEPLIKKYWVYSYIYAFHDPMEPETETVNRIGIATRMNKEGFSTPEDLAGDIQLLADDASQVGKSRLFHGRSIDAVKMDVK